MKELRKEVAIAAPPERVWEVLTDFESYPSWNPFIQSIAGRPAEGEQLEVRIAPPGGRAMRFRPTVLEAEPPRVLRWLGHFLVRGIFDSASSRSSPPATAAPASFSVNASAACWFRCSARCSERRYRDSSR
jgi:hypothetical protein